MSLFISKLNAVNRSYHKFSLPKFLLGQQSIYLEAGEKDLHVFLKRKWLLAVRASPINMTSL
jgi:hypothetical protein